VVPGEVDRAVLAVLFAQRSASSGMEHVQFLSSVQGIRDVAR
jgi:hypothetical protein